MAFGITKRLSGIQDATTQRAHNATADAIDAIAHTLNKGLAISATGVSVTNNLSVSGNASFVTTLSQAAGSYAISLTSQATDNTASQLRHFAYRHATGSDFSTDDHYWQRVSAAVPKGFVGFYGSGGIMGTTGVGLGFGGSSANGEPNSPMLFLNGATGAMNVPGGITQGSRFVGVRGFIGANLLTTGGGPLQAYVPGSSPAFQNTYFVPAFSGSLAAITCKVYYAAATAGTLTLSTAGGTTNYSGSAVSYTNFNTAYVVTFTPGAYAFAAGQQILVNATTSGWAQAAGSTGVEIELWVYC